MVSRLIMYTYTGSLRFDRFPFQRHNQIRYEFKLRVAYALVQIWKDEE
jgi:hypothetical protein